MSWCCSASVVALVAALLACERVPPEDFHLISRIPTPHFRDDCVKLAGIRVIGHDIHPPVAIHRVDPKVPGVRGIVIIETIIDLDGNVCDAAVLKGINPEADAAALAAVKQWRFRPATLNGKTVAVYFDLTVRFE